MERPELSADIPGLTPGRLRALAHLLEAFLAALDLGAAPAAFASQLTSLHDMAVTDASLRWLVAKGFAEHQLETTRPGQSGRAFRATTNLHFTSASCFVLTPAGVYVGRRLAQQSEPRLDLPHKKPKSHLPHYDTARRALLFKGKIVKQFKVRAANQELILMSFEEENWPPHLADPLPGKKEMDAKRRLSDAIKNLNAHQIRRLIRFHGDGTGTGILWVKLP